MPPDDPYFHWLAGFVDGEGCFRVRLNGGTLSALFRVKVRADDGPALIEAQARTGVGTVRPEKVARGVGNDQVVWSVNSKADCQRLVALFRRYPLRAKKARDFALWAEAVEAQAQASPGPSRRISDPVAYARLGELRDELHAVKQYCP